MTSKKITIGFITTGLTSRGGMDRFSKGMMEAMATRDDVAHVIVLTSKAVESETVLGEVYRVLPDTTGFSLWSQVTVFVACMRYFRKCDVVHSVIESFSPGAALAALVLRKPYMITIAATYSIPPKGVSLRAVVKRSIMKFMYRRAFCVATGSHKNIELIHEVMELDNWKFVPFGADYAQFSSGPAAPAPEHPFLLSVGDVKPRKGADMVIKALAQLPQFPELHFAIVGDTTSFPAYIEELRRLSKEFGMEDRIHIMGRASDEALMRMYKQCSILMVPAQTRDGSFEGFPMVFYEAHASGAPIISTDGFGSEYVIKNGYNGFLVHQDSVDELSDAIQKIYSNPALRAEMSVHGKLEAKKHDWSAIAGLYRGIYAENRVG